MPDPWRFQERPRHHWGKGGDIDGFQPCQSCHPCPWPGISGDFLPVFRMPQPAVGSLLPAPPSAIHGRAPADCQAGVPAAGTEANGGEAPVGFAEVEALGRLLMDPAQRNGRAMKKDEHWAHCAYVSKFRLPVASSHQPVTNLEGHPRTSYYLQKKLYDSPVSLVMRPGFWHPSLPKFRIPQNGFPSSQFTGSVLLVAILLASWTCRLFTRFGFLCAMVSFTALGCFLMLVVSVDATRIGRHGEDGIWLGVVWKWASLG